MKRILVAEDDRALNGLVCSYLEDAGYSAFPYYDGESALTALKNGEYDMLITDIMMPGADGFCIARKLRDKNFSIPILFMTARDDKASKMLGFKLGIDDYLVKPFDMDELTLRVGAILRRSKIETDCELTVGGFTMNTDEHTAYLNGEELGLTVREFDLLFKLLSYPKKTFTRAQLMDEFWDFDSSATSRTVDVYMAKIREKTALCEGFEIVTVHGLGYKAVLK